MQAHSRRSNKKLIMLLAVFILPILTSTFLFYFHTHFNFKTTNHGVLVKQPVDVEYLYAAMQDGTEKKWRVLYVDKGICDAACEKTGYQLHQIQKALGKEGGRVHVILMGGQYTQLEKLQQALVQQTQGAFLVTNKIYLVDPLGNLFMYYPSDTNPMNVLKDLKKVLEVSQIG